MEFLLLGSTPLRFMVDFPFADGGKEVMIKQHSKPKDMGAEVVSGIRSGTHQHPEIADPKARSLLILILSYLQRVQSSANPSSLTLTFPSVICLVGKRRPARSVLIFKNMHYAHVWHSWESCMRGGGCHLFVQIVYLSTAEQIKRRCHLKRLREIVLLVMGKKKIYIRDTFPKQIHMAICFPLIKFPFSV